MFYSNGDDYYENTSAMPSLSTSSPLTPSAIARPLQPPIGSSLSVTRTAASSVQTDYQCYRQDVQRKPMAQSGGNTTGSIRSDLTAQVNNGGGRVPTLNGATVVNGINLANLKFVKPAPQCFYWEDGRHRAEQPNCRLWHPRELCKYYPKCTLSAEVCGFGHPFCGEYCMCGPTERSLQKNHRAAPSTRSPPPATVCNGFQQQKLQKLDVVWKNTISSANIDNTRKNDENNNIADNSSCGGGQADTIELSLSPQRLASPPPLPIFRHQQQQSTTAAQSVLPSPSPLSPRPTPPHPAPPPSTASGLGGEYMPSLFNSPPPLLLTAESRLSPLAGSHHHQRTASLPPLQSNHHHPMSASTQPPLRHAATFSQLHPSTAKNDDTGAGGMLLGAAVNDRCSAITTTATPSIFSPEGGARTNGGSGSTGQSNTRVPTLNGATVVNGINLANLKFVKPAPQCFYWEDSRHRVEQPDCRLWHPRELCKYYPKCTLSAEVCGFGHPFCGEYCMCGPTERSLQKNHRAAPSTPSQHFTQSPPTTDAEDAAAEAAAALSTLRQLL